MKLRTWSDGKRSNNTIDKTTELHWELGLVEGVLEVGKGYEVEAYCRLSRRCFGPLDWVVKWVGGWGRCGWVEEFVVG